MADPVEDDLGDGALAFQGFRARLVIDGGGEALQRGGDVALAALADDEGLGGMAGRDRLGRRQRHRPGGRGRGGPGRAAAPALATPCRAATGGTHEAPSSSMGRPSIDSVKHCESAPLQQMAPALSGRVLEDG